MSEANTSINQSQLLSEPKSLSAKEVDNPPVDNSPPTVVKEKPTKPSPEFLQNADWYAIARRIRQHNRQLVQKIIALEKSLTESEEKLETQITSCRRADNLIEQQSQELKHSHQKITRLSYELENAHQEYQRQHTLIESLSQQLQASQERVALLERECSLLQDNYKQQKDQLLKAEKTQRELQIRLQRQQRYTLQFKAALDRYLEAPSDDSSDEVLDRKVELKIKEIQPWSKEQKANNSVPVKGNLAKKILATQDIEEAAIQPEIETPPEIEPKSTLASDQKSVKLEEKMLENTPPPTAEDNLKNERDREGQLENINFPFALQQLAQQKTANNIHQTDNNKGNKNSQKKEFLKLPKLPKFSC
jgi:hypothetical protein